MPSLLDQQFEVPDWRALLDQRFYKDMLQGLTDAANRGGVGGLLGGPVDLATGVINAGLMGTGYLGNKMGLLTADQMPQPIEHPIGSSEWLGQKMQDAGMVSANRNPVAETIAGLLTPSAIKGAGKGVYAMEQNAAVPASANISTGYQSGAIRPTVMRPQRIAYPDIYSDPRELVAEAAVRARQAPEDPLLKRLFNVTRDDQWNIAEQGAREGNILERPFVAAANPKGAAHASEVMNPRNVQRLQDIIGEGQKYPEIAKGMASWYTMDPLYWQFVRLHGADAAPAAYDKFNKLMGMSSPSSDVLKEINRGTAANWLANQGRFEDFRKYAGMPAELRGADFPADMQDIIPHIRHSTHVGAMGPYLDTGRVQMKSAKVPSYYAASGVPETGFQTRWPVGDAHWSRLVGLADVRGATSSKGVETIPKDSASVPEMISLGPWWRDRVAGPMGLESVPAQAIVWGAGSGATGVTSPIGMSKLELIAQQIGKAARRMGVSPETARDMIIMGKAHAGNVTPEMATAVAGASGAGLLADWSLRKKDKKEKKDE